MATSRYFAGRAGDDAAVADDDGGQEWSVLPVLRARRLQKRKREAAAVSAEEEDGSRQLTEMEKQVVALRQAHPDKLLLFECGYRMRIFAEDAEVQSSVIRLRAAVAGLACAYCYCNTYGCRLVRAACGRGAWHPRDSVQELRGGVGARSPRAVPQPSARARRLQGGDRTATRLGRDSCSIAVTRRPAEASRAVRHVS